MRTGGKNNGGASGDADATAGDEPIRAQPARRETRDARRETQRGERERERERDAARRKEGARARASKRHSQEARRGKAGPGRATRNSTSSCINHGAAQHPTEEEGERASSLKFFPFLPSCRPRLLPESPVLFCFSTFPLSYFRRPSNRGLPPSLRMGAMRRDAMRCDAMTVSGQWETFARVSLPSPFFFSSFFSSSSFFPLRLFVPLLLPRVLQMSLPMQYTNLSCAVSYITEPSSYCAAKLARNPWLPAPTRSERESSAFCVRACGG